jgi:hypothetical protein
MLSWGLKEMQDREQPIQLKSPLQIDEDYL